MERKSAWEKYSADEIAEVMAFAEGYRQFISVNKIERENIIHSLSSISKMKEIQTKSILAK